MEPSGPMRLLGGPASPEGPIRSVYVHAPFCVRRCVYCDFAVTVALSGDRDAWLEALGAELRWIETEGTFSLADTLSTLYVGGGTPSLLGPDAMEGLARLIGPSRLTGPELEWTAEANPESYSDRVARGWAGAGVNRISLGAQSFDPEVLRLLGRMHSPSDVDAAVRRAREVGTTNLSLDLIFGLPDEARREWVRDLELALKLEVPHLSVYGLTIEPGTPLARAVARGELSPASEARYCAEFMEADRRLGEAGFVHYEVSNYALPGFESGHNRVYWDLEPYLGLGSGAHSFLSPRRRWNARSWNRYREAVAFGRSPTASEEVLSDREVRLERIWLGLRTDRGIALSDLGQGGRELVRRWVRDGRAVVTGGAVRLTPEGWLLLDHMAVELDRRVASGLAG